MNSEKKERDPVGNRHIGAKFRNRGALGAAAVIHTAPVAVLLVCLAMLSCHMLLA
jgi:hypothetical protein